MRESKKLRALLALKEGPLTMDEIYAKLGAKSESEKSAVRRAIAELRNKGFVMKIPKTRLYTLTGKGMKLLECLDVCKEL